MISNKNINKIINESINLVIENARTKRKYINRIYKNKEVDKYLHHSFKDDNWHYFWGLIDAIGNVPGIDDVEVNVENGGYREYNGSRWKEYKVKMILETGEELNGIINCNFCGSVKDPTDRYDITFTMW